MMRSLRASAPAGLLVLLLLAACAAPPGTPAPAPEAVLEEEPAFTDTAPAPVALLAAPAGPALTANTFPVAGAIGTGLPWRWRGGQVVADPATGTALQFTYPAGRTGGTAPGNVYVDEPALKAANAQSVTFTGRLWVSPNWQGHGTSTNKTVFLGFGMNGNQVILNLRGKGSAPLYPSLYFQGMATLPGAASCGAGGCGGQWAGRVPFTRGAWHDVALTITRSTASLTVDGQLVATRTGLQFTQGAFYLAKVALNPTWGGGGDRVVAPMQLRWADVRVAAGP